MSTQSKTTSAKEMANTWFDRYRSQNVDGMLELFAPEAIIEYVPLNLKATPRILILQVLAQRFSIM
jgi:hypothetical protein